MNSYGLCNRCESDERNAFRLHSLTIIFPAITKKNNNKSLTIQPPKVLWYYHVLFLTCAIEALLWSSRFLFSDMEDIYYNILICKCPPTTWLSYISYTRVSLIHSRQQDLLIYEVEKSLIYKIIAMYMLRWLLKITKLLNRDTQKRPAKQHISAALSFWYSPAIYNPISVFINIISLKF